MRLCKKIVILSNAQRSQQRAVAFYKFFITKMQQTLQFSMCKYYTLRKYTSIF